jgi:hypothetical protein
MLCVRSPQIKVYMHRCKRGIRGGEPSPPQAEYDANYCESLDSKVFEKMLTLKIRKRRHAARWIVPRAKDLCWACGVRV